MENSLLRNSTGGVKEGRQGTWQLYFVSKSANFLSMRLSLRCSGSGTWEAAEAPSEALSSRLFGL